MTPRQPKTSGSYQTPDGQSHDWEQQPLPLDVVPLEPDAWRRAAYVGIDREWNGTRNGRTHRHGKSATDPARRWDHYLGAIAECAVAQELNAYWCGSVGEDPGHGGDVIAAVVGPIEVRSTEHVNGHLTVYADDASERPFVLVTGFVWDGCRVSGVRVPGWIIGRDAQVERYWKRDVRKRSYWVPQSDLKPLASLKRWTEGLGS